MRYRQDITQARTHICKQRERENHSVNNCQCQLEEKMENKCGVPVILSDGGQSVFSCASIRPTKTGQYRGSHFSFYPCRKTFIVRVASCVAGIEQAVTHRVAQGHFCRSCSGRACCWHFCYFRGLCSLKGDICIASVCSLTLLLTNCDKKFQQVEAMVAVVRSSRPTVSCILLINELLL